MVEANIKEESYPRYRWVMVALIVLFFPIFSFVNLAFGMVLPDIREELHFGLAAAGWLASASWMLPAFLAIPLTLLAVRFRPKQIYLFVLTMAGVFLLFQAIAPNFQVLFLARLGFSMLGPLSFTAVALFRTQWIHRKELGLSMGLQFGAINLSQSISLLMLPSLIVLLGGWRHIYVWYAGYTAILLIVWVLFGKERDVKGYSSERGTAPSKASFKTIFKYREFGMLGIAILGNVIPQMALFAFWPTFLIEERGVSGQVAGGILALFPIGGLVAALTSGTISDKVGLRKPFIWPFGLLSPIVFGPHYV